MDLKKFCEDNYISDFGVSKVDYVTKMISDLWKIHAFREGNTRTVLVCSKLN